MTLSVYRVSVHKTSGLELARPPNDIIIMPGGPFTGSPIDLLRKLKLIYEYILMGYHIEVKRYTLTPDGISVQEQRRPHAPGRSPNG